MNRMAALFLTLLTVAGCSFGDRLVHLRSDPPAGDPQVFRGISIVIEEPLDLRPGPHDVIGAVRSGVGVKTADITTDEDVSAWIGESMAKELGHAGFLVSPRGEPGFALHVETRIVEFSCEEAIGFGAKMTLDIRVTGDATRLLQRKYRATEHHVVVTGASGRQAADSLRVCLSRIMAEFMQDLIAVVEAAPD